MIVTYGNNLRIVCVCGVLLTIIGMSTGRDSSPSLLPIEHTVENTTLKLPSENITKMTINENQLGWKAESTTSKSIKGIIGRKIGRPSSWPKDSYLEALKHSRTSADPREGIVSVDGNGSSGASESATPQRRREYNVGPVYTGPEGSATSPRIVYGSADRDSFSMIPSDSYSLPTRSSSDFAGPQSSYGPPQPPRFAYGPPSNGQISYYGDHYSPPQQGYGPPTPGYGHGVPHGMSESSHVVLPTIDFSWPFALKLNAFTLAKILLKLVIFKLIVKFIAVICLLLFIPKLEIIKKKGNKVDADDDDDEGRRSFNGDERFWDRVNTLTTIVSNAVDKYESLNQDRSNVNGVYRDSERGGVRDAFSRDETWNDYAYLLRSYALEETRRVR